jgi:hypothetical protein
MALVVSLAQRGPPGLDVGPFFEAFGEGIGIAVRHTARDPPDKQND